MEKQIGWCRWEMNISPSEMNVSPSASEAWSGVTYNAKIKMILHKIYIVSIQFPMFQSILISTNFDQFGHFIETFKLVQINYPWSLSLYFLKWSCVNISFCPSCLSTGCQGNWCSPSCQKQIGKRSWRTHLAPAARETDEGTIFMVKFIPVMIWFQNVSI